MTTLGCLAEKQKKLSQCNQISKQWHVESSAQALTSPQDCLIASLANMHQLCQAAHLARGACRRTVHLERTKRKRQSQNCLHKKFMERTPLHQLPGNVTDYVPVSYNDSFSPYLEIFSWVQDTQNLKHLASRRKSKFLGDPQQFFFGSLLLFNLSLNS